MALIAQKEDYDRWLAGHQSLLNFCVCSQYPTNCRFHCNRMVTDGPHNLLPDLPSMRKMKTEMTSKELTCYFVHFYDGTENEPTIGQRCLCGQFGYRGYTYSGEYVFRTQSDRDKVRKTKAEWSFGPRPSTVFIGLLSEFEKASLYKSLYDDGMRIDRAMWIIKEAK